MGHVYQGRFKSFPVESDEHLLTLLRYVERNPLRANLVDRAEAWRWGSLYRRLAGTAEEQALLTDPPLPLGTAWVKHVNRPQTEAALAAIRRSVVRGQPFGRETWTANVTRRLGLEHICLGLRSVDVFDPGRSQRQRWVSKACSSAVPAKRR